MDRLTEKQIVNANHLISRHVFKDTALYGSFNTDWNDLMEAVNYIEETERSYFEIKPRVYNGVSYTCTHYGTSLEGGGEYSSFSSTKSKIDAVYQCVVDYFQKLEDTIKR